MTNLLATLLFRRNAEESQLRVTIVENGRFDATEGNLRVVHATSERKHHHHVSIRYLQVLRGVSMSLSKWTLF